jgi:hypothetical protein
MVSGGELPERTNGTVSKTVEVARPPRVQIPYSPPPPRVCDPGRPLLSWDPPPTCPPWPSSGGRRLASDHDRRQNRDVPGVRVTSQRDAIVVGSGPNGPRGGREARQPRSRRRRHRSGRGDRRWHPNTGADAAWRAPRRLLSITPLRRCVPPTFGPCHSTYMVCNGPRPRWPAPIRSATAAAPPCTARSTAR